MTPKITALMAEKAIKDGAEVKTKPNIQRPVRGPAPVTPIPAPAAQNDGPDRRADVMEASMAQQLVIAHKQNAELSRLVDVLAADKPVRLKVHRDMDRSSPTYLLLEYIDIIPLKYTRKLNS